MKTDSIVENDIFTVKSVDNTVILRMKGNPLYQLIDLHSKETLFDCMDEFNNSDDIRVVIIMGSIIKPEYEAYADLFRKIKSFDTDRKPLQLNGDNTHLIDYDTLARFCNAVNQFVLKIVRFKKFVIHADSGLIISPFMNLSLACDYRIISRNSVYKNPYLQLGLVPKGGSAYFLSRLIGYRNAKKVLLADGSIHADKALELGLVDQVVPAGELFDAALAKAIKFAQLPPGSLTGIKKLMNCSSKELEICLQSEDELFLHIVNSKDFRNKLKANSTNCLGLPVL